MVSHEKNPIKKIAKEYKLLEIKLRPEDEIYVADIYEYIGDSRKFLNKAKSTTSKFERIAINCDSLTEFQHAARGNEQRLPVIVSWNPFSLEQVEVVETYSKDDLLHLAQG